MRGGVDGAHGGRWIRGVNPHFLSSRSIVIHRPSYLARSGKGVLASGLVFPCVLAFVLAPARAAAGDELTVYGRINLTLQHSDEAMGTHEELRNNASRIGVKGELPLNPGLKAIYQLEFGVNIDGDDDQDTFTHRNQFVGLEGAFGTIKAGRHDTALKQAQGDFDLFDDLEGDIAGTFNGENRLRNYVGYESPRIAKAIQVIVNVFPGEDPAAGDDDLADGASVSAVYDRDDLYVALAHDRDVDGEDVKTLRLVAGYPLGPVQAMLLYQRTEAAAFDDDGFGVSLAWERGPYTVKLQYLGADQWRVVPAADPPGYRYESLFTAGVDRALGEDTRVFAFYTTGDIGGTNESNDYLALGIQHEF